MASDESSSADGGNSPAGWIVATLLAIIAVFLLNRGQDRRPVTQPDPVPSSAANATDDQPPILPPNPVAAHTPREVADQGYAGSDQCRDCHADNHRSWHDSYHRTMTQTATPQAVVGNFENTFLQESEAVWIRLYREGDQFWMERQESDLFDSVETNRFPIVMTTGSHHMQVYWTPIGKSRSLANVPFVYLKGSEEWVPWSSCFLQPPGQGAISFPAAWNSGCVNCHTTHGQPRATAEQLAFDTQAAEFGISCEACHGPGAAHVALRKQNPDADEKSDPIVNPSSLNHRLSSHVCAACHSYNVERADIAMSDFRPGQDLTVMRQLLRFDAEARAEIRAQTPDPRLAEQAIDRVSKMFWSDGVARTAGREFQGMMKSGCFVAGEMSCISCHQMHQSKSDPRPPKDWANDQLNHRRLDDRGCTQCHDAGKFANQSHTHHATESTGSRCLNCHMPHTSYGLLKAVRSHRVNSPNLERDREVGRPNACNLCHLDQTQQWTALHLKNWYGIEPPPLKEDERDTAAGVLWTLQGDAGVRALLAWHFGWQPAREASATDWMIPYLNVLLDDPYDAVRYIARRSLNQSEEHGDMPLHFLDPPEKRNQLGKELLGKWEQQPGRKASAKLLITDKGGVDQAALKRLLADRDRRPVYLLE